MLWGIKKPHQKIKENPKKEHSKKPPKSPPSPRSPAHCSAYALHCLPLPPCPPALYRSTAARQVRAKWQVESKSKSQPQPKSKSTSRRGGNQSQKKAETFRLWILRQIWVICKGWSRRTGGSNWPEREKKKCAMFWSNDSEYCIPCKPKGEYKKFFLFL